MAMTGVGPRTAPCVALGPFSNAFLDGGMPEREKGWSVSYLRVSPLILPGGRDIAFCI